MLVDEPKAVPGWWPVLDSVSWSVSYDPEAVYETPPNAIAFFYAWQADMVDGQTFPIADYPDASLGVVETSIPPLELAGGGPRGDVTLIKRWQRFDVDVPARLDKDDVPCRLVAAAFLVDPGSSLGPVVPPRGALRIVYHYRPICEGSPC